MLLKYTLTSTLFFRIKAMFYRKIICRKKNSFFCVCRLWKNYWITCCTHMTSWYLIKGSLKTYTFWRNSIFKEILHNFSFPVTICIYINTEYWLEHFFKKNGFVIFQIKCWFVFITPTHFDLLEMVEINKYWHSMLFLPWYKTLLKNETLKMYFQGVSVACGLSTSIF